MTWESILRDVVLPLSFILFIAIISWRYASIRHRRVTPSSREAIKLPSVIGVWFSGLHPRSDFDIRGVLLQILVIYGLTPVLSLMYLGGISRQIAANCVKAIFVIVVIIGIIHFAKNK